MMSVLWKEKGQQLKKKTDVETDGKEYRSDKLTVNRNYAREFGLISAL